MRIRRLKYTKDRVNYALDKKLLKKIGWHDQDEVEQFPDGYYILCLINKTYRDKEFSDYRKYKDALEVISENDFKRQQEYMRITKKYKNKKRSKAYKLEMNKFNRLYLTEDEALEKNPISKKKLINIIKNIERRIEFLRTEKRSYQKELKKLNN